MIKKTHDILTVSATSEAFICDVHDAKGGIFSWTPTASISFSIRKPLSALTPSPFCNFPLCIRSDSSLTGRDH